MTPAVEIARALAERIDQLVAERLPGGVREGRQWRCGSVAGEAGSSLAVELAGPKRGLWVDHANPDHRGDALDLVKACLECTTLDAIAWSERWLGIELNAERGLIADNADRGYRAEKPRPAPEPDAAAKKPPTWPGIWRDALPISGTLAEVYLQARGLVFADLHADVLRFAPRRARLAPGTEDVFEHHPALLALVRDVTSGKPCGLHSVFLRSDGSDRLRDKKGKTSAGRLVGGAVMLSEFEDVTYGLTIAEGVETAIGVLMDGQAPCWALCGAGNLRAFPILPEIQCLTIAADTGDAGQAAAREVAARWRKAGREARVASPRIDDWAASRKTTR